MRDWTIQLGYELAKIRLDVSMRAKYDSAKVGIMVVGRILVRKTTHLGGRPSGGAAPEPPPPDPENLQDI